VRAGIIVRAQRAFRVGRRPLKLIVRHLDEDLTLARDACCSLDRDSAC
jgi:hypothetical protein